MSVSRRSRFRLCPLVLGTLALAGCAGKSTPVSNGPDPALAARAGELAAKVCQSAPDINDDGSATCDRTVSIVAYHNTAERVADEKKYRTSLAPGPAGFVEGTDFLIICDPAVASRFASATGGVVGPPI